MVWQDMYSVDGIVRAAGILEESGLPIWLEIDSEGIAHVSHGDERASAVGWVGSYRGWVRSDNVVVVDKQKVMTLDGSPVHMCSGAHIARFFVEQQRVAVAVSVDRLALRLR